MNRIKKLATDVSEILRLMPIYYQNKQELDELNRIMVVENQLAQAAGGDFLQALKPTLEELSSMTVEPFRERYIKYINEATELILQGADRQDVLRYYEMKLVNGKDNRNLAE